MLKQYLMYLFRWQLSTPILAIVLIWMSGYNQWTATIVANLIGGIIFFWVDKHIFATGLTAPLWELKDNVFCAGCGKTCRGVRLVKTWNYDRTKDSNPEFRCDVCSRKKLDVLKKRGVKLEL